MREFRRPGTEQSIWQVFGPDGRLRARVTSARRLEILDVGVDYLLGLARDATGVEIVQLYRLDRAKSN